MSTSDESPKVAIVVPTWKNKTDLWLRQANYYANTGFQDTLYIGDSSEYDDPEQVAGAVRRLQDRVNIVYHHLPDRNDTEAVSVLLHSAREPYAVFSGDDDLFVPASLRKCARFLDDHKEFSAVHGVAATCVLESGVSPSHVKAAVHYSLHPIENVTASERLRNFLASYCVTLFSLHRTEDFRRDIDAALPIPDRHFRELLPCCLSVVRGKVKQLECLYLLRMVHDRRYVPVDRFDWITGPDWLPSYEIFRNRLSEELALQDGIRIDQAREVVKEAFWPYLSQALRQKSEQRYGQGRSGLSHYLRQGIRGVPGVRQTWHRIRSFLPGHNNKVSLPALLWSVSPYHADFMPIYRAITAPSNPPMSSTPWSPNSDVEEDRCLVT